MNTAVRTMRRGGLATHNGLSIRAIQFEFQRVHWMMLGLIAAIVLSAFALVFQQDSNRRLISQLEQTQSTSVQVRNQWSQLLQQKTAMAGQGKVALQAKADYGMALPAPQSVKMVYV
jgi:cell division protein FtsL